MAGTPSANENQVELLLGDLGKADCFGVLTPLAQDVLPPGKRRILYALGVDLQVLSLGGVVGPVDAVIYFVALDGSLRAVALLALELEIVAFPVCLLSGV